MDERKDKVGKFIYRKLSQITALSDQGEGKEMLSLLRKGVGHVPGDDPKLLGVILIDMPEEFFSKGTEPTKEEWACYIALTLYAMHQQGNSPKLNSMNSGNKISLGKAMAEYALLSGDSNAQQRMAVMLQALATSKDMKEFSYHLKTVIQLLKTKGIALNYPRLAEDIYDYQFEDRKSGIFLKWGQDFFNTNGEKNKESSKKGE